MHCTLAWYLNITLTELTANAMENMIIFLLGWLPLVQEDANINPSQRSTRTMKHIMPKKIVYFPHDGRRRGLQSSIQNKSQKVIKCCFMREKSILSTQSRVSEKQAYNIRLVNKHLSFRRLV